MLTATRKERERRQRESKILQLACDMLQSSGYLGLSMDRIAEAMQYSKGTIYQHFRNKEEIILALANEAIEKRLSMFRKAATWAGRSRERMAAIGVAAELFVGHYPHHFAVEQIVRSASMWEKTSEERRQFMRACEASCMQVVGGVVRDAVAQGDLKMPAGCTPETLVFGLWSMHFGTTAILTSSDTLPEVGIADGPQALRTNIQMLLDGYGWRPLSSEADYSTVRDRIASEVFSDELAR